MVEGPIPWTAIHQYSVAHGVYDPDEVDRLSALVKRMDIAYLTHVRKKSKSAAKIGADKDTPVQRINEGGMSMR